jgi:HlyD family secretion protein
MARQFGQTGGPRGSGTGRSGGPSSVRFQTQTVYEPNGAKGDPKPVSIRPGITDGRFTQVVAGDLNPGDTVIVGLATAKAAPGASSPMGAPGGGRRGF